MNGESKIYFHVGLAAVCLVLIAVYGSTQSRLVYLDGRAWDAGCYVQIAEQVQAHQPMSGPTPFVFRIGLPWLVGKFFGNNLLFGFKTLNIAFGLLTLLLLIVTTEKQCQHKFPVIVVALLWVTNPHSPFRLNVLYPALTDAPTLFMMLLILVISQQIRNWHCGWAIGVGLLSFIGVLFREIAILAPVAGLFAHTILLIRAKKLIQIASIRQLIWHSVPCLTAVAGLVMTHWIVRPVYDYSFVGQAKWSFVGQTKWSINLLMDNPGIYGLAIFAAHGPAILAIFTNLKPVGRFLIAHQHWLVYGGGILLLAVVGGSHTDRFMYWGFPVVLLALAVALDQLAFEKTGWFWTLGFFIPLGVAQVLAFKIFTQIPNAAFDFLNPRLNPSLPEIFIFAPYGASANTAHMFAAYMGNTLRMLMTYQYMVLTAFVVVMLVISKAAERRLNRILNYAGGTLMATGPDKGVGQSGL